MSFLAPFWYVTYPFVVAACTILNRVRGGGVLPSWPLPGRQLYYVTPLIGILAGLVWPWEIAVGWAVAYIFWAVWAWGMIFDLNNLPPGYARDSLVSKDPVERLCMACSFGDDRLAWFWRMLVITPALVPIAWWTGNWMIVAAGPVFAMLMLFAYAFAWRFVPDKPIPTAEPIGGFVWGCMLIALKYV